MNSFYGPFYSSNETTTEKPVDNIMPVEVEQSTGFHVFELHAPTAGVSVLTIVVALIAIALAYGCYKKCCGVGFCFPGRQYPQFPMFPMQPMAPFHQPASPAVLPA